MSWRDVTDEPVAIGEVLSPVGERLQARVARVAEVARADGRTTDATPEPPDVWAAFSPAKFRDARLDALRELPAKLFDSIADWAAGALDGPVGNLLIFGPVGCGKTYAAMAVCRHLIEAQRQVRWWPTVELLDALRPDGALTVAQVTEPPFVFLDDLGGEKPTEWVAERLYAIVNRRWLDERPLIVTSNLEPPGLRQAVGSRTWDRLRDGAVPVQFEGKSRRGREVAR